jgi:N-acylneuraminate cytidylyltransferase
VPRKNLREVGGKPLLAWTVEAAKKSLYIDRLILSSDDSEIIAVAKSLGCDVPFVRPPELARDDTPGVEPVLHALQECPGFDFVVLLQPTSPLRIAEDIDACLTACVNLSAPCCVSVSQPDNSPYWMFSLEKGNKLSPFVREEVGARRQDLPPVFALNGAVYVADTRWLLKERIFLTKETVGNQMPRERSVDLDDELDLKFADYLLRGGVSAAADREA